MIFYRPIDGHVQSGPIKWQPRSCFLMSAMGSRVPDRVSTARKRLRTALAAAVIRVGDVSLPSDLVRTEYIQFDRSFSRRFAGFISSLQERADYYLTLADQLEKNPLLAIDYLRRSYLLSGDAKLRRRAEQIFKHSGLADRAKHSVERNLLNF